MRVRIDTARSVISEMPWARSLAACASDLQIGLIGGNQLLLVKGTAMARQSNSKSSFLSRSSVVIHSSKNASPI